MAQRDLYKDIDFKKNFRIYRKLVSKYKGIFIFLIALTFVTQGLSVFERYLFKVIIDRGTEFASGSIIRSDFVQILLMVGGAYLVSTAMIIIIGRWYKTRLSQKLEANLILDVKRKFFNHILHLSHRFHTTHKTGALIARMNRGTNATESLTDFIINSIAPLVIQLAIVTGALIFLDVSSAIAIIAISATFILWGFFMSNKRKISHVEMNMAEDKEKGTMSDVFTNIDSVKYFGKEKEIKQRYNHLATDAKKKLLIFWDYNRWFRVGQGIILSLGTFFIMLFPLLKLLDGEISMGTLTFIYTVYLGLMGPLFGFVQGIRRYYRAIGDFDSLFKYGEIENEIKESPKAKNLEIKRGNIEFKDVSFGYRSNNVLKKINLKIGSGEKVAIIGHSGSGKTTLVKLLYRLYDPDKGEILIDNENIKNFKQESLRSELAIVPQECILFDDTIYNNIAFSNPSASKKDVKKAIKFAQLDKFISSLPKRENTIVGERGVKLSGGEKQRVSIARAILADKKVLVLDEATSSLDSKTEFEIQKGLKELMKGRTSIIIAHRLSTIMRADKIVVVDEGKIVQIGKHKDLIKRRGVYQELWNLQKGGYIEE